MRPRSVLVAVYLLAGMVAFWLTAAIATLFALPQYDRHHTDLAQDPTAGAGVAFLLVLFVVCAVIASGLSIPLVFLDAGGRPAARTLTWILGGVAGCIALILLLLDPFDAISWHRWLMTGTSLITVTFTATMTVLIARRSSGEYFRDVHAARQAMRFARTARYWPVPAYGATQAGWTGNNPPPAQLRHAPQPSALQHPPPLSEPPPTENEPDQPS